MLNFQVSLQKREMFVWKGKDKQISLAQFTSLPISLQQVNISGILRASARSGNSEVRVSTGLTVNRQMALKLTVNRQKRNIFTVNRQMSEPKLAVKLLRYP